MVVHISFVSTHMQMVTLQNISWFHNLNLKFSKFWIGMSAITMFFMPESPYFLITKGKNEEALKSLQWLRGSENMEDELEEFKREFRDQKLLGNVSYFDLITDSVYLRPFLIVMALMFFQQFSGINAVFFYLKVAFWLMYELTISL